ncbi:MAG: cupin domain-containing protein [Deltaproteobacteria bacterium]|nr:cupin domain-containing protein [Deltaproteobacteria bacterium]
MNRQKNLFNNIPPELSNELTECILQEKTFKIKRIISRGHASPEGFWYNQDDHEWVVLLKGSAGLRFENKVETVILNVGDYIHIPAHCRHRVEWTDARHETLWLAIHYR